ncbi:MAG: GNAT family N-acetyltransferase [Thermodesulfobacteriota bacterium]
MEIRTASMKDVDAIIELSSQLCINEHNFYDNTVDIHFPKNYQGKFKRNMRNGFGLVIVAIDFGNIEGYLIGSISKTEDYRNIDKIAEIDSMFVKPNFRSQGVGIMFVNQFIEWAKAQAKRVKVVVSAKNNRGIKFYRKAGFIDHEIVLEMKI